MKIYFLSDGNRKIGPFSATDITTMLFNCQINILDQVFNSETSDWVPVTSLQEDERPKARRESSNRPMVAGLSNTGIAESEDSEESSVLLGFVNQGLDGQKSGSDTNSGIHTSSRASIPLPTAGSAPVIQKGAIQLKKPEPSAPVSQTDRWLAKEGGVTLGPYSFITILGMILDGTIREHDQLRIVDKTEWAPASSYREFNVNVLKDIQIESAQKIAERGGFKRKNPRLDVKELIAVSTGHNLQHTVMGDVSAGGCSLIPNYPMFKKGEMLYLSIFHGAAQGDQATQFNAQGVVLNVMHVESKYDDYYKHSVQFTALTEDLLKQINARMVK